MIEQVVVTREVPIYPPATLLQPCDSDPRLPAAETTNEDVVRQSLARRAALARCRTTLQAIIDWTEENQP